MNGHSSEVAPAIKRPKRPLPQVFTMVRNYDDTGVSGAGEVGAGVVLSNGAVIFEWFGATPSENRYSSFDGFLAVHVDPHPDNKTEIIWHFGGPEA